MSLALASRKAALLAPWLRNPLWRSARAVPSLDLRFADNKSLADAVTGQNLITFTRASSGTYVGSDGLIKTATTNLQRHSEDFTQGLTPNNATLTANQGIAPNGAITADQLLETTANGLHNQEIADHVFIAGATYTFSCYAKSIGGRNFAPGFPTLFSSARFGFFNLSGSGTVVNTDAGVTASIQAVGDGWYRCSITSTCVTGGGARVGVFIANGTSISYVGDAAKGLLLWGAQLEQSSTVSEYIPTTSTINSAPRFNHNPTTGESLGLLVEEQRTNLLLRSEELNNVSWQKFNSGVVASVVTSNQSVAPSGVMTADKIELPAVNSAGFCSIVYQAPTQAFSTSHTFSCYLRGEVGGEKVWLEWTDNSARERTLCTLTTSWQRFSLSYTTSASGAQFVVIGVDLRDPFQTATPAQTFYAWGAQLEAGSFPTSYIPTTTATATRSADVASITGTAFSSWYSQSEGTVFASSSSYGASNTSRRIAFATDGTTSNRFGLLYNSSNAPQIVVASAGTVVANPNAALTGANYAIAAAYKLDDYAITAAGSNPSTDTTGALPVGINQLSIGSQINAEHINGTIRRLTYWPQRLANSTLQAITQ